MIRTPVILLFVSLILAGCAGRTRPVPQADLVCPVHDPVSLDSVLLPPPLSMDTLESITSKAGWIELTPEDFRRLIGWQHELDRYLRDLRQMMMDIQITIEEHNDASGQ